MRYLLFCILFLSTFYARAQELFFSQPAVLQNLPSLETYHILQDRKGFIWVVTDAGIGRYDGNKLTVYTVKDGLPENVVLNLYEDQKGRIWFTTLSGYFFYFEDNQFHSIEANEQLIKFCTLAPIYSFFVNQDTLYISVLGHRTLIASILKIPETGNFRNIFIDSSSYLSSHSFIRTNPSHPTQFLRGGGKKVPAYALIPNIHYAYDSVEFKIPFSNNDTTVSNAWLCTIDKNGTVYIVVGKKIYSVTRKGIVTGCHCFDEFIVSCYADPDGDLWICTRKGGYLLRNGNLDSRPVTFLKNISLSSVFVDREGSIWVATQEKGIMKSLSKHVLFFNMDDQKPVYLQKDSDRFHISFDSFKILTCFKTGSMVMNDLSTYIETTNELAATYQENDSIYGLCMGDFFILNKKNRKFYSMKTKLMNANNIIKTGKDSILFMCTNSIFTFYNKTLELINMPFSMRTIFQLKNGRILLSSRNNNGIYELKDQTCVPFLNQFPQLKTRINAIIEDVYGNLWFATNDHGLYCLDQQKKMHQYTTANGLASDKINTLAIDQQQHLWLGTYNGLTKISYNRDPNKISVCNFNKSHGIPNLQTKRILAFDGKIVCIATGICYYFNEQLLEKNDVPPLNYIHSVSVNNTPYPVKDTAILNYDENNLHVLTASLTYKNTEQQNFIYKLMGYDNSWHASTTGDISYTNLPYGNYVLTIYALNNDLLKSTQPATFTFVIQKPFWLTWWFILCELILFSVGLYILVRFWKNRIQRKEQDKAMINQKIAEFKMTALRSQMNPHFVFNAITSIQHYIIKQDTFKSYNYLAKFSLLIRTILDNSKEEYIALSQEINTLKLYIELEQIRFKQPFTFILDIDEQLEMDTYIPTMLIQPYVENSIWHGLMPKKSDCILEVKILKKETHIFVIIKDNGVGRKHTVKKSNLHESKGMSITEQRIKELETTNEKKFNVSILDLTDETGNATGTEVHIIIPFDL